MAGKFDPTGIALYHLVFIGNLIERTLKAFDKVIGKVDEEAEMTLYVTTSSMIMLYVNSFLEEYHQFVRSDEEEMKATIIHIKATVKPAMKVINQWKDSQDFRNQVVAHNLRDKADKSVFERGLSSYDIPQDGANIHVLISCIGMIKEVFESAFREKIALVQQTLDAAAEQRAPRRYDKGSFAPAIEAVRLEINENIKQLKREHCVF